MGYTRVETGDRVVGVGTAPEGRKLRGLVGTVVDTYTWMGDDVLVVNWDDGTTNNVRQENVSGTRQH